MKIFQRLMGSDAERERETQQLIQSRNAPQKPVLEGVLCKLLHDNRKYAPVLRGGGMCNHYSMAVIAAHSLGASDTELAYLHQFLDVRSRVPHQEDSQQLISQSRSGNWTWGLGQIESAGVMRGFFLEELQRSGIETTLQNFLPRLVLGQHKGLFHPMIRLQFGLISPHGSLEEVAEALAYSYGRHEPLYRSAPEDFAPELQSGIVAATTSIASEVMVEDAIHAACDILRSMYKDCGYTGKGNSLQIMAQLYQDKNLHRVCLEHFPVSAENAEQCHLIVVQLAAQLYQHQPSLTTLHAVTGGHSISDIIPWLPVPARAVAARLYFIWLSVLFVEKGCPGVRRFNDANNVPVAADAWPKLRQSALRSLQGGGGNGQGGLGDEPQVHVLKMAFTCDKLFQKRQHSIFLDLARLVVEHGRPW